jgi:GT2 family glycosyltransferase
MSQFAAFIMTYNRPDQLRETIRHISTQTLPPDFILVVDNGNSLETKQIVESFSELNIAHSGLPENVGPAGAAHFGLDSLISQGYEWIYWGDDDDPPKSPDTFERLLRIAEHAGRVDIGAVGEVGQRFDWKRGAIARLPDDALLGIVEVDVIAGNQQFLVNAAAVKAVGLPDQRLFFGYEEPELCLRMRRAGYRLLVDGERMKESRTKAGRIGPNVGGSSLDRGFTNLWRNYYSTRNFIYMMRNTFRQPRLAWLKTLKEIGKSLLSFKRGFKYGFAFSRMSLLGVVHGFTGRMGKTIEPYSKHS